MRTDKKSQEPSYSKVWHLRSGAVYRRKDLAASSKSVDRDLQLAVSTGRLRKVAQGLYYVPQQTPFGEVPPDDHVLIEKFLEDSHFLILNPSYYNTLGLGMTQLYNKTIVYNHKRHGKFLLGNRSFDFRVKHRFPMKHSTEFLWVDCLNNLDELAEDCEEVVRRARESLHRFDSMVLRQAVINYASTATRKLTKGWFGD